MKIILIRATLSWGRGSVQQQQPPPDEITAGTGRKKVSPFRPLTNRTRQRHPWFLLFSWRKKKRPLAVRQVTVAVTFNYLCRLRSSAILHLPPSHPKPKRSGFTFTFIQLAHLSATSSCSSAHYAPPQLIGLLDHQTHVKINISVHYHVLPM
jgi:hypothetical protein